MITIKTIAVKQTRTRLFPPEAAIQTAVFDWAALRVRQYPDLWFLHAIPNGGSRHKAEAANLKRQGVKKGVPDIHLPVPRGDYHGLYIELKSLTGRLTKEQAEWINRVRTKGFAAFVCYSFEEAVERLEWYLNIPRPENCTKNPKDV